MAKNRSTKRCHSRSKRGGDEPDGPDVDPSIIAYKEEKIKAAEALRQRQEAINERQRQAAAAEAERQRQAAGLDNAENKVIINSNYGGKSRRRHRRSRRSHHFSIKYKFGKKHCKKSRRRSHHHSNKKSRKSRRGHRVRRR
jgi:hypothetical protein